MNATVGETRQRRSVQLLEHEEVYHKSYRDTARVCGKDTASADVLRVYEWLSERRTIMLIEEHAIPEPFYPHQDDLWIDEQTLLDLEWFASWNRRHSTYARTIADVSPDRQRPSLIERGFLTCRYIARPYDRSWEPDLDELPATLYRDERGYFLVVKNRNGVYVGNDGSLQCARAQGFQYIVKQYRVEVDVVQAALTKSRSVWREPPEPLPRWQPIVQQKSRTKKEGATGAHGTENPKASSSAAANEQYLNDARRVGTKPPTSKKIMQTFAYEHNTSLPAVSRESPDNLQRFSESIKQPAKPVELYRDTIDLATLCVAPWSVETILGLASFILAIPTRPPDDDEEALRRWIVDWLEPAQRLYAATISLSPLLAWERIDLTTRYMDTPGSPSWWQRGPESGKDWRRTKAPITLRNVADRYIFEYDDFTRQRSWWPSTTTRYDGSPLVLDDEESYEGAEQPGGMVTGITEVTDQAPDRDEAASMQTKEPTTDEVPVVSLELPQGRRGMTRIQAEALLAEMMNQIPELIVDGVKRIAPNGWGIQIAISDLDATIIECEEQWYAPPGAVPDVDEAIAYAASMTGGGSSPPVESEVIREYDAAL